MSSILREYRCPKCQKLLFRGLLIDSQIEIKCSRCREIRVLMGEKEEPLLCYKAECANRVTAEMLKEDHEKAEA